MARVYDPAAERLWGASLLTARFSGENGLATAIDPSIYYTEVAMMMWASTGIPRGD